MEDTFVVYVNHSILDERWDTLDHYPEGYDDNATLAMYLDIIEHGIRHAYPEAEVRHIVGAHQGTRVDAPHLTQHEARAVAEHVDGLIQDLWEKPDIWMVSHAGKGA